jgi:hypothetical protein
MAGCEKSRYQRFPEGSKRLLDRTLKDETVDRACGQSSQSRGSLGCIRSGVVVCWEGPVHPTLDVAMMNCGTCHGCGNVCVHENPAEETGIGYHALSVLVELGPNGHIVGRPIGEALGAVERDLAFWTAVESEFDRLHSVLCSLEAA